MSTHKNGFTMRVSIEFLAVQDGFFQEGAWREIPLTDEDRASHSRAKAALKELKSNRWVHFGPDGPEIEPLIPAQQFTPSETMEEWIARYREAKGI